MKFSIIQLSSVLGLFNSLCSAKVPDLCDVDQDRSCPKRYTFDTLACTCFSDAKCKKLCQKGYEFDPRVKCECLPGEEVLALYPVEAYPYLPENLKIYIPDEPQQCVEADLLEPCGTGLYFEQKYCMCFAEI